MNYNKLLIWTGRPIEYWSDQDINDDGYNAAHNS